MIQDLSTIDGYIHLCTEDMNSLDPVKGQIYCIDDLQYRGIEVRVALMKDKLSWTGSIFIRGEGDRFDHYLRPFFWCPHSDPQIAIGDEKDHLYDFSGKWPTKRFLQTIIDCDL